MPLSFLLAASIIYSMWVWLGYKNGRHISDGLLATQLLWDSAIILVLVCLTGRSTNPFIYYLLVVIAISASLFTPKIVWAFCLSGIAIYSLLMYLDFNQHLSHTSAEFQSHLIGMWVNFVGSALLISFFISRLTTALRDRELSLAAAREEVLKSEQLIGIGTLAASTVHSFGTPLSTIAMTVGEIEERHKDEETSLYAKVIKTQIERCKHTMNKLSSLAGHDFKTRGNIALVDLLDDIKAHFTLMNSNPMPRFTINCQNQNLYLPGGILLKHALINLIDNAVHAANTVVFVKIDCLDNTLQIIIEDDGDGISPELLSELGDSVVTSKETGLGIGFLLANSTIERLNGQVRFSNADVKNGYSYTRVVVEIPLASGEIR